MLRRVKIRRNGHATGGKVALVADTWALMLQRCGSKFSTDASPFVATRLFTADGFEIEALEEVSAQPTYTTTPSYLSHHLWGANGRFATAIASSSPAAKSFLQQRHRRS